MKILCLLVVLANISLLLWEYRSGGFTQHQKNQALQSQTWGEPIKLLAETVQPSAIPQEPPASNPDTNQQLPKEPVNDSVKTDSGGTQSP